MAEPTPESFPVSDETSGRPRDLVSWAVNGGRTSAVGALIYVAVQVSGLASEFRASVQEVKESVSSMAARVDRIELQLGELKAHAADSSQVTAGLQLRDERVARVSLDVARVVEELGHLRSEMRSNDERLRDLLDERRPRRRTWRRPSASPATPE